MNRIPKIHLMAASLTIGAGVLLSGVARAQQASYPTADDAAAAFVQAVRGHDQVALAKVLGSNWKDYVPVEGIQQEDVDLFLKRYDESHRIDAADGKSHLDVGSENWVLPLPLVQGKAGWHFDMAGAEQEVRTRRIGQNELAVEQAMLAYYDAQRDYASEDRDGDKVLQYAEHLISSPGKHDGLYWPTTDDQPPSPLGSGFTPAAPGQGYYGYRYKILTAQGPSAPGGAYNYVVGGRMTNGFALVAWPVQYGETGVMSFMVSHDGQVFEKDLGKSGANTAQSMKAFDPDSSWKEVDLSPAN
jgi:hypothetical protein